MATIEDLPKLIGRARTYTNNGGAVSSDGERESHDVLSNHASVKGPTRWQVEASNRRLLKELGLDDWHVWRYGQFLGLTAKDRLGLSDDAEVQLHYQQIAEQRKSLNEAL